MRRISRAFLILLTTGFHLPAFADEADLTYQLPSSITVSGTTSSAETRSMGAALRLFLPRNYWNDATLDRAIEKTDDLETSTTGGSLSIGTDPLDEFSVDFGFDAFGIEDQFRVQEARARLAFVPASFESILEIRTARFSFANSPNPIFQNREVVLDAQTLRLEFGWYGWTPWSIRAWTEQSHVAGGFSDLARPLAPVFIPVTAISTALSWPGEEYGISSSYSRRRWGARLALSTKRAIISGDRTFGVVAIGDYKWTRRVTIALRVSRTAVLAESNDSAESEPILSTGLDLTHSF